jgi:surface antigen
MAGIADTVAGIDARQHNADGSSRRRSMRRWLALGLAAVMAFVTPLGATGAAWADDDDGYRHGHRHKHHGHRRGAYEKYEYRDGRCKVEIKRGPHGYKEERKCHYGHQGHYRGGSHKHAYRRSHRQHSEYGRHEPGWRPVAPAYADRGTLTCNRELVGQVLGGAAGALAGSNIGKGSGQLYAVAGGALIGVLAGGEVGWHMDRLDRSCVNQTLEHVPSGQSVVWRNPDFDARYEATPQRTYQTAAGRYCREYITTATVAGRSQQVYGTACRQPDGSWELVD